MVGLLVNIDVDDLDKAIGFYRRALGFEVSRRLGDTVVEMSGASAPVYLLEKPAGSPAFEGDAVCRAYTRHWTPVHLDFVVENVSDAVRKAVSAGASIEADIQSHVWGRLALMNDPFGHGFCLLEFRGRGYDEIARENA